MNDEELLKSVERSIYAYMEWDYGCKRVVKEREGEGFYDWSQTELDEIDIYNAFHIYWFIEGKELVVSGDDGGIYLEIEDLSKLPTLIQGEINND